MSSNEISDLIQKLGFPVVVALAFGAFAYRLLNRFLAHLEGQVAEQKTVNEKFAKTLGEISATMQTVAEAQRTNMTEFRAAMPSLTCRNFVSKP